MNGLEEIRPDSITIAVMTPLPVEYQAVRAIFGEVYRVCPRGPAAGRDFSLCRIRSKDGGFHNVAYVCLHGQIGTNAAATQASLIFRLFPRVNCIIVTGIACAVPYPQDPEKHVRLGDIVVCNRNGVIQHDRIKKYADHEEYRGSPFPPYAHMLFASEQLCCELGSEAPRWETLAEQAIGRLGPDWARPCEDTALLVDRGEPFSHPPLPLGSRPNVPRVHHGPIGSGNAVIGDPDLRDRLREKHGILAVEMEAAGVAEAAWTSAKQYFVVRGTCDYGNETKNNVWHKYASVIAAAYTYCVIEEAASNSPEPIPAPDMDLPFRSRKITIYEELTDAIDISTFVPPGETPVDTVSVKESTEAVIETTLHQIEELQALDEYEASFSRAEKLGSILSDVRTAVSPQLMKRALTELARVAVQQARYNTKPGDALDLSRAKTLFQRAKNVSQAK